ncbi:MAG: hypothetical protein AAGK78_14520 [Planctomycetota bacterium]
MAMEGPVILPPTSLSTRSSSAPHLLSRRPTGRLASVGERLWDAYPHLAILLAALLLATGCSQFKGEDEPGKGEAAAALAAQRRGDNIQITKAGEVVESPVNYASQTKVYPVELPVVGTAAARAVIRHGKNQVDLINLSKLPWPGGKVWLNERWGIDLPHTDPGEIRRLDFELFVDAEGGHFPTSNMNFRVTRVDLQLDDELARVQFGLAH